MQVSNLFGILDFSKEKLTKISVFSTENMSCDLYCFEAQQEQKVHTHEGCDKVYTVLEGTGIFSVDGEERTLMSGQIVLAPAGSAHGVRNPHPERLICLVHMSPPLPPKD